MDIISEFIHPELITLIPALYFIKSALNKAAIISPSKIQLIIVGIGIFIAALYTVAITPFESVRSVFMCVFVAATEGVIAAGCSSYAEQLLKIRKGGDDK